MPNQLAQKPDSPLWNAWPLLPLCAFLVLAPNFEWSADVSYYDQKRLAQLFCLGVIAVVVAGSTRVRSRMAELFKLQSGWIGAALLTSAALGLASALRSAVPIYALAEVGLAVSLACAVFVTAAAIGPATRRVLLLVLVAVCGMYTLRFVAGYVSARVFGATIFLPELYSNFSHIRFFSQLQSWSLPLIVLPAALLPWPRARWPLYALAAAWWALHFGAGTRGTSLGLVVALVAVPLLLPRAGLGWAARQLGAAVAGALLYWLAIGTQETWGAEVGASRVMSGANRGRFEMLNQAFDMIRNAPFLGGGPQHFAHNPAHVSAHPHNTVAQMAAEWGLPATILLCAVLAFAFLRWVGHARNSAESSGDNGLVHAALTGSAITAAVHALFSGILVMPLSQMCMVLVLGWMLAEYRQGHAVQAAARARGHVLVLALVMAGVALWLPVAMRDGPGRAQLTETYRASGKLLRPRFWHQGFIYENPEQNW